MKEKKIIIDMPPGFNRYTPVDQFHDGMFLTWDEVTEIYEDEERRMHFIVFNYTDVSIKEMFQKMLELGIMDFGFHTILKSNFIYLWYFPGGAKEYQEHYLKNTKVGPYSEISKWLTDDGLVR